MQSLTLNKPYERRNATLFHLFACYPVCDRICFYLCIGAIIALSRTCKALSRTYRDLLLTQWNIDTKLSRFVTNPRGLRLQLRDREAVISGSFAVQFFDRTVYPDSDLDIFIEHGDHGQGFLEYLTSTEGYQLAHSTARSQLENDGTKSPSYGELRLYHSGAVQMVSDYATNSNREISY